MISQYALGRHGWVMAVCFAAFAAASACLFAALIPYVPSLLGRIGLGPQQSRAGGVAPAGPQTTLGHDKRSKLLKPQGKHR
jgi:hypothetical protein